MPKQPTCPAPQIKFLHRPTLRQEVAILAVMEAMEAIAPGVGYEWESSRVVDSRLGKKPPERN